MNMKIEILALAECDAEHAEVHGVDLNPFSTPGGRHLWQKGWDGKQVPNMVEESGDWRKWYRGKMARELDDAKGKAS